MGAAISAFGRKQDAQGAQYEGQSLRRRAEARAGSGGGEGDRGGQQPDGGEQHVTPEDPDKDEGRRRQRQQRQP